MADTAAPQQKKSCERGAPCTCKKCKCGPTCSCRPKKEKKMEHPPTAHMVRSAIKTLNARDGSSLQAIKKSIAATYKVDVVKLAPSICKYIRSGVASGALVQVTGQGASGSFKLGAAAPEEKKPKPAKK